MTLHRALLAACALSMMTAVASVADSPPPPACPPHHADWGSLTPEQRMMRFELARQATANMTDDQRHAWRQAEREKFEAMSDSDRQKYTAGLTAQWNALTADRKAEIQKQAEQFRSSHPMMDHPSGCN